MRPDSPETAEVSVSASGLQPDPSAHAESDLDDYLDKVRWTLHECDAGEAAALLDDDGTALVQSAIVVVGEPGVGKSSLVNALLEVPALLPTGTGGATGAYCVIQRGPALAARVHLPGGETRTAAGEAARERVLEDGRADADPIPTWIEVELPDARLDGIQLVDTPGVGGLTADLDELTLQSLQLAEALIFVSSCSAPLSRSDFLRSASARVERVIFALSKVDGPAGWRKVAGENQVLLAEEIPRFAGSPILPVSAKLASDAQRIGRPELSERLLADSGIPALWQEIHALAGRRTAIRQANRLRAAHSALQQAHDERRHARSVAESAVVARTELEQQEARLAQLGQRSEAWYFDLSFLSRKLQRNATRYLRKRSEALRARFDHDLSVKGADREACVRKLIAGVAELEQEVAELVRARLAETITVMGEGLALDPGLPEKLEELVGDSLDVPVSPPSSAKRHQPGEGITQTQTSYMGMMMGHAGLIILTTSGVTLGALTGGLGWAVAGAFGVGWTVVTKKIRGSAISDAALREWAAQALTSAVYEINSACDERIDEATNLLQTVMRTAFPQEMTRLRRELEEAQRVIAASEAERAMILETINYQIDKIRLLSNDADIRLRQLALPRRAGESGD